MINLYIPPDEILPELDRRRNDGSLARDTITSYPCYQSCPSQPDLLKQISPAGMRPPEHYKFGVFLALSD